MTIAWNGPVSIKLYKRIAAIRFSEKGLNENVGIKAITTNDKEGYDKRIDKFQDHFHNNIRISYKGEPVHEQNYVQSRTLS